jgi:hypothetical protein
VADRLRQTVLSPLVWLQTRAEEGRTSRVRFRQVTTERRFEQRTSGSGSCCA